MLVGVHGCHVHRQIELKGLDNQGRAREWTGCNPSELLDFPLLRVVAIFADEESAKIRGQRGKMKMLLARPAGNLRQFENSIERTGWQSDARAHDG